MPEFAANRFNSWFTLGLLVLLPSAVTAATLTGKVLDDQGQPAADANVVIPALRQHTHTATNGTFRLENLPQGVFAVKVNKEGLPSRVVTADLRQNDADIAVALEVAQMKSDTVIISGFRPTDEADFAQSVSVIEGKKLQRSRGQSLVQSVEDVPGVANLATGNFVAKPVIRGMASYRSLLMVDSVPEEAQQFGDEHGTNVDVLDIQRIEVVRGPGSLLFGSGALGGVMNVVTPELPSTAAGNERLSGKITGDAFSNSPGGAGAVSLYGATGALGYRGTLSYRQAGNTMTPDGAIPNSAHSNLNGSTLIGISEKWGLLSLRYAHYDMKLNLPAAVTDTATGRLIADPTATQYQKVAHDRLHLRSVIHGDLAKLEISVAYQQNRRREFEDDKATDSRLNLVLDTLNSEIKIHHAPLGPLIGTLGLNHVHQRNQTLGSTPLIPAYTSNSYGAYLFEELRFDAFSLLGGVRGDTRILQAKQNETLSLADQTVQNSAATGAVGAVWRFAKQSSLYANVGRGFRAPTAFELFSNGVHEGTGTYDIGDAALKPETSLTTDLGTRIKYGILSAEVGGYYNTIQNYIFATPTGSLYNDVETGSQLAIYRNRQGDATIMGAELDAEAAVLKWLTLHGGVDIIKGRNDTLGEPLPLIPANRYRLGVTLSGNKMGAILNPYVSLKARYVARKTEISEQERTLYPGFADYTLVSLSTGGDFSVGGQLWTYTIGADNLLNQRYVDYLSRQKLFALNPGVNVYFKISAPLDLLH